MRRTRPGRQNAALPPELAAHQNDSAAYEDWRAWRQRRRTWFTEHGLSYDFSEDLRLLAIRPPERRQLDPSRTRALGVDAARMTCATAPGSAHRLVAGPTEGV